MLLYGFCQIVDEVACLPMSASTCLISKFHYSINQSVETIVFGVMDERDCSTLYEEKEEQNSTEVA